MASWILRIAPLNAFSPSNVHHEMEHLGHLRGFFAVGRPADLGEVNPEAIGSATSRRRQVHGRVCEVSLAVFRLPRVEVFPLMAESAGHVCTTCLTGFYLPGIPRPGIALLAMPVHVALASLLILLRHPRPGYGDEYAPHVARFLLRHRRQRRQQH